MNLMVISLLILLLSPLAYAKIDFTLDSPESISAEQEFTASINSELNQRYDVKIYVNQDTKDFSEIFDGGVWRSPNRYLISIFPDKKDFLIMSHYIGDTNICAQLRETSKTTFSKVCNNITIRESTENKNNKNLDLKVNNKTQEKKQEEKNTKSEQTNKNEVIKSVEKSIDQKIDNNTLYLADTNEEKIILNKKPKEILEKNEFVTQKEKQRLYIIYAFLIFTIFVIILLSLKKL